MHKHKRKANNRIPDKKRQSSVQTYSMHEEVFPQSLEVLSGEDESYFTYGPDNQMFTYINDRFKGSSTNRSIITSISQQMYGKGLAATDVDEEDAAWLKVLELLPANDLRRVCQDYKEFGQACMQVAIVSGKAVKVMHTPVSTVAKGAKNKDGDVENYYISVDWSNPQKYTPVKVPAFGTKGKLQLLYIGGYTPGLMYFQDPDYFSGLQSAETEQEMSNFHLTNVKNGFSPSLIINMNNGVPETDEEQHLIKNGILKEWTGTGGSKVVIAFNDDAVNATTVEAVNIQKPHDQYSFLSEEAQRVILKSHRVTSPLLIGIKDASGFSSNADELKVSFQLWNSTVIRPFQDVIIEALQLILELNGLEYDIFFETLQPIEFTDDGVEKTDDEAEVEKETGITSDNDEANGQEETDVEEELSRVDLNQLKMIELLAEGAPEGYEIDKIEDVGDEPEDLNYEVLYNSMQLELAGPTPGKSKPITKSTLDSPLFKVRYRYKMTSSASPKGKSRQFCILMNQVSGQKQYFRKEDIGFMSAKGVNNAFGHKGQNYSIWDWKGGVYCYHLWERVIFKKKLQANKKPFIGNPLQNTTKVKSGKGVNPVGKEAVAPILTPTRGVHPSNL